MVVGFDETHNVFHSFDLSHNDKVLCAGTEAKSDESHLIFWSVSESVTYQDLIVDGQRAVPF